MSGDIQLELWLNTYKATALSSVLEKQGTSIERLLQETLIDLYEELVPQEAQRMIQARIDAEQAVQRAEQEAARRYTAFRIVENGTESFFQMDGKGSMLNVGRFLRQYLKEEQGPALAAFQAAFARLEPITAKQYEQLAALRAEDPRKVSGMFELDLDRQVVSAVDAVGGWRNYSMRDVSVAAYYAYRKNHISQEQRESRFLDQLAGRELTSARAAVNTRGGKKKGGQSLMSEAITEINKDTFWALIAQAKEQCGQDLDAYAQWLEDRLMEMSPEQALNFDNIVHGYRDLAYKYGLWSAASTMCDGCTDDGFIDFRGWLIAQGREVYMSALKDPDSLADIPVYDNCYFESLGYVGDLTYAKLTGRDSYHNFDRNAYQALVDELGKDIVYGEGIDYPYTWSETAAYLPRLCAKYMAPEELAWLIENHNETWNVTSPDIQEARATAQKSKKIKKGRGDAR